MPSASHENVFSILGSPISTLAAGIIIGLAIGHITAPSTRRHSRVVAKISKGKLEDSTDNESSDEEPGYGEELQDFTNSSEECKLVLVVRTDLGMGKGISTMSSYQW
jgi:PTH2 family peptidyl-tRNA hydrolase